MNNIFLIFVLSLVQPQQPLLPIKETHQTDTTVVGRIIDRDSIFQNANFQYQGVKYFYGVHHLKVELIDVSNSGKITDTVILAYVYNKLTETQAYKRNFGLSIGEEYIFYIHSFKPCQSDFPRIQGRCSEKGAIFYPESNKLIKSYQSINRIIFATKYKK